MAQIPLSQEEIASNQQTIWIRCWAAARSLLTTWELYPIFFLAAFFHFFRSDTVIFSDDEANVFRLARDAIAHGLLPLTSNRASLGNLNPPLVVYVLMLPASLSANPLWGEVLIEMCNVAAILLTYFFARRYYGRLAGTIAALLYATSIGAWTFSRNIWPQNFLPIFVILFIWMLFRGVVERRQGWFFWAVALIGILYQFHGSTLYLFIPLGVALLFARKTVRWREVGLATITLILLFAPYIYWQAQTNFSDITIILSTARQQAILDTQALHFYLFFLHPILVHPYLYLKASMIDTHLVLPNAQSILFTTPLHYLNGLMLASFYLAVLLLVGGMAIVAFQALSPWHIEKGLKKAALVSWWNDLQASPARQGLVLLLLWQVVPLLLLSRHSVMLFVHYFIFLLPGQFIFIAICVVQITAFARQYQPRWGLLIRYGMAALTVLLILAQLIGCTSDVIDLTAGNFSNNSFNTPFNNLRDQQQALQQADQLAQRLHIGRIYVMNSNFTYSPMEYLASQIKTPVEVENTEHCLVLPAPEAGPVLLLASPNSELAETLLGLYTDATLAAELPRLGGAPYKLYILTARPEPAPVAGTFTHGIRLLSPTAQLIQNTSASQQWLTTRWRVLETHAPAFRTDYGFTFQVHSTKDENLNCMLHSTWAGDQVFAVQTPESGAPLTSQITMQAIAFTYWPQILSAGPLKMLTYHALIHTWQLHTADRKYSITLPVAMP